MRKDVILGISVGGVIFAVVVVWLTVFSGLRHPVANAPVPAGGQVSDASSGGTPAPEPLEITPVAGGNRELLHPSDGAALVADAARAPAVVPVDTPARQVLAESPRLDPWVALLSTGQPIVTHTPGDSSAGPGPVVSVSPAVSGGMADSHVGGGLVALESSRDVARPSTRPSGPTTYKIQSGDTFSTIAAARYGSPHFYPYIMRANPGIDPAKLKAGMQIVLPDVAEVKPVETPVRAAVTAAPPVVALDATHYQVVAGDNLHKISVTLYGKSDLVDKIYQLNKEAIGPDPSKLKVGMVLTLPVAITPPAPAPAH